MYILWQVWILFGGSGSSAVGLCVLWWVWVYCVGTGCTVQYGMGLGVMGLWCPGVCWVGLGVLWYFWVYSDGLGVLRWVWVH
jgi:hypothetical protein